MLKYVGYQETKKCKKLLLSERIRISQFFTYILYYIRLVHFILKFKILMRLENLNIPLLEHMLFPYN